MPKSSWVRGFLIVYIVLLFTAYFSGRIIGGQFFSLTTYLPLFQKPKINQIKKAPASLTLKQDLVGYLNSDSTHGSGQHKTNMLDLSQRVLAYKNNSSTQGSIETIASKTNNADTVVEKFTSLPVTQVEAYMQGSIWVSPEKMSTLPISQESGCEKGSDCSLAWSEIIANAQKLLKLTDTQISEGLHPREVLAAAIAAKRLQFKSGSQSESQGYFEKAVAGIVGAPTQFYQLKSDELSEGKLPDQILVKTLGFYIAAADILNLSTLPGQNSQNFTDFLRNLKDRPLTLVANEPPRTIKIWHESMDGGISQTAGALRVLIDAYLGDHSDLTQAWQAYLDFTQGRKGSLNHPSESVLSWVWDPASGAGISPLGATCVNGKYPANGAISGDQGRGGPCPQFPGTAPVYTPLPWDSIQGLFVQAVVFDHLGYLDSEGNNPWYTGVSALQRAVEYQWYLQGKFNGSWYDSYRAAWVKSLAGTIYGFKPIPYAPSSSRYESLLDFTQWTHHR